MSRVRSAGDDFVDALEALVAGSHQLMRRLLRGRKITIVQFFVLRIVAGGRSVTAGGLARKLGVAPQTMTTIVDSLERSGRLTRSPSPSDRRAAFLKVTPNGAQLLASIDRASYRRIHQGLEDLPESTVRATTQALRQVTRAIEQVPVR